MDQQVEDLRERMKLLQQDRRANIDLLEANKQSNSEEIRAIREENKDLRVRQNQLQRNLESSLVNGQEIKSLQKELLHRRTEYDSLKVMSSKRERDLKRLEDESKTCELEARQPSQEDGPVSRRIRTLENRLDKAMIKYNEAQSIQSTYESIVKRLKEERVSFDNQLTALERTLQAKEKDFEELLLLSSDANHAREASQHKLHDARRDYDSRKARRDGELRERHQVVKVRRQIIEKQELRRAKRKEIFNNQLSLESSNLNNEAAAKTCMSPPARAWSACVSDEEAVKEQEEIKIDAYENAFRKIKEATGVSDVNEVISKIFCQEDTTKSMVTLTNKNQKRLEELYLTQSQLKKEVEEAKYSSSNSPLKTKEVGEKEAKLALSATEIERCKNKFDRIDAILINLKAGVKHLKDKIENVGKELRTDSVSSPNDSLADVLLWAGDILIELVARTREREISEGVNLSTATALPLSMSLRNKSNADSVDLQESRPYNQRIVFPSMDDDEFDNDSNQDEGYGDANEDEISREKVKKASTQLVQAQERRKPKERAS